MVQHVIVEKAGAVDQFEYGRRADVVGRDGAEQAARQ
jgi:hypothetical protein